MVHAEENIKRKYNAGQTSTKRLVVVRTEEA